MNAHPQPDDPNTTTGNGIATLEAVENAPCEPRKSLLVHSLNSVLGRSPTVRTGLPVTHLGCSDQRMVGYATTLRSPSFAYPSSTRPRNYWFGRPKVEEP